MYDEWVNTLLVSVLAYRTEVVVVAAALFVVGMQFVLKSRSNRRGNHVGKKAQRERELQVNSIIGLNWILTVEELWMSGVITQAERDKFCDFVAFRVSDKSLFDKGRVKQVKTRIKQNLKKLKKMKPLPIPDAAVKTEETAPKVVENNVRKLVLKPAA